MNSIERQTWVKPVSASNMCVCLHCPRCYMFQQRWCIFPKVQPIKKAADLGHMVHRLLRLGPGPSTITTVRAEVTEEIQYFIGKIDNGEDLLGGFAQQVKALEENIDKAVMMATLFWERYPQPPHLETLAKEQTIEVSVNLGPIAGEIPILIRMDEVLRDTRTGNTYIRDYKTTSRDVAYTLTGYQYSAQCRMYRLGVQMGLDCGVTGFILDILQAPSIRCKKKQTFEDYLTECRGWYKEKDKSAAASFCIHFVEPLLPLELKDTLIKVDRCRQRIAIPELFPRDITTSKCTAFNRQCVYYKLCSTDEGAWDTIIENEYEVHPPEKPKQLPPQPTGDVSGLKVKGVTK